MGMLPDNFERWQDHDNLQEAWLQSRPKCVCCGEYIQDESAVQITGSFYCDRCLDDMRIYIED